MYENFKQLFRLFLFLLAFTVVGAWLIGTLFSGPSGNVALIKINGGIFTQTDFFYGGVSSETIVDNLEKADSNPDIKAILIEINSPGGSVYASKEIVKALEKIEKPKICLLKETASSGAYWIASKCDSIIADDFTLTGSISVAGSYLEFSGLMEKYGVNYVRLVSGEKKDIGSPYKAPTEAELEDLNKIINEIQKELINDIAENRNLSVDYVASISDGSLFLGKEAKEMGLVDLLGDKNTAFDVLMEHAELDRVDLYLIKQEISFRELVGSLFARQLINHFVENEFSLKA
ncbi:MAG TPA: signal peptide peptidase SppA [Candidatus Woesearchaeota archaeon]|nr:signal peptide peptidase SppA [Candidatus Woesearchaeota archaeon]